MTSPGPCPSPEDDDLDPFKDLDEGPDHFFDYDPKEPLRSAYYRWIDKRPIPWTLFATLSWARDRLSRWEARGHVFTWIRLLSRRSGIARRRLARAIWVIQKDDNARLHAHVMVADTKLSPDRAEKLWELGNAVITKYDPTRDGLRYVLKHLDAADRGAKPDWTHEVFPDDE